MKLPVTGSIRTKLAAVITVTTFIALAIAGIALLAIDLRGRAAAAEKDGEEEGMGAAGERRAPGKAAAAFVMPSPRWTRPARTGRRWSDR